MDVTPCNIDTDGQFTGAIGVTLCSSGTVVSFAGEIDVTPCNIDTDGQFTGEIGVTLCSIDTDV